MKHTSIVPLVPVLSLCLLAACGKDDGGSDNSSITSMGALHGTWNGDCKAVGDAYGKTTYVFHDSSFVFQSTAYSDSGCTTVDNKVFMRGSYALPGDMRTEDGTVLAMIDYTSAQATWEFVARPSLADDWSKLCGDATVVNDTLDVLGKTCDTGTYTLSFAAETFGTIYVAADGKIHPTDVNLSGATVEERSTAVDIQYGGLTKDVVVAE